MTLLHDSVPLTYCEDGDLAGGGVYLICFDKPLHHARHYLGWAKSFSARIRKHRSGNGSRLLAAVNKAGIGWRVVRVWPGADRDRERQLKNCKAVPRLLCPRCRRKARKK